MERSPTLASYNIQKLLSRKCCSANFLAEHKMSGKPVAMLPGNRFMLNEDWDIVKVSARYNFSVFSKVECFFIDHFAN